MTDEIRKLVSDKLDEIGMTMKEASTKIGRNESFVHQFLKRGHPAELRERDREKLAQVLRISPDDLRGPANPLPLRFNGGDPQPLLPPESGAADIEELRDRCRVYERALRKIVAEEPNCSAADLARAALRLFR
jgi:glutathione S-transferase